MDPLSPAQRRALRAKAHHLHPVVTIGQHGLTPAVAHEIDLALVKHELVKIRVFSDARDDREALLAKICEDQDCAAVQHLGKVLVVWRPNPEAGETCAGQTRSRAPRPNPAPSARRPPKTGPRAPVDPVRERRRGAQSDAPIGGKGLAGRRASMRCPKARRCRLGVPALRTMHPQPRASPPIHQRPSPLVQRQAQSARSVGEEASAGSGKPASGTPRAGAADPHAA